MAGSGLSTATLNRGTTAVGRAVRHFELFTTESGPYPTTAAGLLHLRASLCANQFQHDLQTNVPGRWGHGGGWEGDAGAIRNAAMELCRRDGAWFPSCCGPAPLPCPEPPRAEQRPHCAQKGVRPPRSPRGGRARGANDPGGAMNSIPGPCNGARPTAGPQKRPVGGSPRRWAGGQVPGAGHGGPSPGFVRPRKQGTGSPDRCLGAGSAEYR